MGISFSHSTGLSNCLAVSASFPSALLATSSPCLRIQSAMPLKACFRVETNHCFHLYLPFYFLQGEFSQLRIFRPTVQNTKLSGQSCHVGLSANNHGSNGNNRKACTVDIHVCLLVFFLLAFPGVLHLLGASRPATVFC